MNTNLLMLYMESVQLPTTVLTKAQRDVSFPVFAVASTGLLLLLAKIFGEWLAEYLIRSGGL